MRFEDDIGSSESFQDPILYYVRKRREHECVKREPEAQPEQDPAARVEDQVRVATGTDDAGFDDHKNESHDDDGKTYPQRVHAIASDGSTLSLVVGDPMLAVAIEGPGDPMIQSSGDLVGGES